MNPFYAEYIATAKILAKARGLNWDLVCDDQGKVSKDTRWNLTELVGMLPPPTLWLGQIGVDPVAFDKLNEIRRRMNQQPLVSGPMPQHWRDLYQAVFVHQLLVGKTKPQSAMLVAQGIRRLAPVAETTPPWAVTPEQIQQAYNAVLHSGDSGKLALDFATTVRNILDRQKLADIPALARFCIPYPTSESRSAQQQTETLRKRQNAHGGKEGLRRSLAERKSAAKLPEDRAFWELARTCSRKRLARSPTRSGSPSSRCRSSWAFGSAKPPACPWTGRDGANIWMPMGVRPENAAASPAR
ncbi:hypothetical protein CO661_31020 [Sinorhizobium fredii]|uniref:Uncharacterized protein n=1 Tax=Rhizobium fredii TaxID=380 RepID=A0A2A6LND8_RHIFR|nr:hypothetical protein [Sinorhizobium fredii]PDT44094.1 hypothetical protein CO661_31020 [Sinorhizobium fredii]